MNAKAASFMPPCKTGKVTPLNISFIRRVLCTLHHEWVRKRNKSGSKLGVGSSPACATGAGTNLLSSVMRNALLLTLVSSRVGSDHSKHQGQIKQGKIYLGEKNYKIRGECEPKATDESIRQVTGPTGGPLVTCRHRWICWRKTYFLMGLLN